LGRTGEHFMEFSVPGFIKRFCSPNAILTLAEYLVDYAPEETQKKGWEVIEKNIKDLEANKKEGYVHEVRNRVEKNKTRRKRPLFLISNFRLPIFRLLIYSQIVDKPQKK
jgi:hypothetical protein